MNKYNKLWQYIKDNKAGVVLDHSFLRYKKELPAYGFEVKKISLKNKVVKFHQL